MPMTCQSACGLVRAPPFVGIDCSGATVYQHCMRQAVCAPATVLYTLLKSTVIAVCQVHYILSRIAP